MFIKLILQEEEFQVEFENSTLDFRVPPISTIARFLVLVSSNEKLFFTAASKTLETYGEGVFRLAMTEATKDLEIKVLSFLQASPLMVEIPMINPLIPSHLNANEIIES